MKKLLTTFTLASMVLLAACGATEEETTPGSDLEEDGPTTEDTSWVDVKEAGKLVVGTSGTYAPVTFRNEENELTGFDIEVVKEIGERLDLEVEFKPMDFDGILPALRNGQIDMAANDFAITEERQEIFTFTEPHKFSYGSAVVRAEEVERFDSARDLEGVPVALGSLTSNYAQFAENIGAEGTAYDGGTEAILRDIINGNRDAYLNDVLVLQRTLEEFGDDRLVVAEQVKYHATESAFPMLIGSDALKEKLDEAIADMREDGTIAQISEEFLGADASEPIDSEEIVNLQGE